MLQEFKQFIMRGNVIDLAVAVVMGAAFNKIVESLVGDIITPLILNPAMKAAQVENLAELAWNGVKYGSFLATVINFLVVSFAIFMLIKGINKLQNLKKKKEEEIVETETEVAAISAEQQLLTEIRDLLKK